MNILDAGYHETYLTCAQHIGLLALRCKDTDFIGLPVAPGRLDPDLLAPLQGAIEDTHQRHHAEVIIEPGVDNQRLQRCFRIALGRWDIANQALDRKSTRL